MTAKARHCDECDHYDERKGRISEPPCAKQHKPRFYKPTDDPHNTNWGWKRRCEDFKESTREPDRLH